MRALWTILIASAVLAGCRPADQDDGPRGRIDNIRDMARAGPNFTPIPGYQYQYHYRFALPSDAVFDVQNKHVNACDQLGIAQCQVVDMQYDRGQDGATSASLRLQFEREGAANFGTTLLPVVTGADGLLVSSKVSSFDEKRAQRELLQGPNIVQEQIKEIDRRLNDPKLSEDMKILLRQQRQRLSATLSAGVAAKSEEYRQFKPTSNADAMAAVRIPSTVDDMETGRSRFAVISIQYDNRKDYDGRLGFRSGWNAGVRNFVTMTGYLFAFVGLALPWLILVGGVTFLWRRRFKLLRMEPSLKSDGPAEATGS